MESSRSGTRTWSARCSSTISRSKTCRRLRLRHRSRSPSSRSDAMPTQLASGYLGFQSHVAQLLRDAISAIAPDALPPAVSLERPKRAEHGDFASNVALSLAKTLKRSPRDIADAMVRAMPASPHVARTEIAGAGFINIFLKPETKRAVVPLILAHGASYGRNSTGRGDKVQIEFVSANPTRSE